MRCGQQCTTSRETPFPSVSHAAGLGVLACQSMVTWDDCKARYLTHVSFKLPLTIVRCPLCWEVGWHTSCMFRSEGKVAVAVGIGSASAKGGRREVRPNSFCGRPGASILTQARLGLGQGTIENGVSLIFKLGSSIFV